MNLILIFSISFCGVDQVKNRKTGENTESEKGEKMKSEKRTEIGMKNEK